MKIYKFAAIDVGSNAMRLLIGHVVEMEGAEPVFRKISLVRVPIRLGEDVFTNNIISGAQINRMVEAFIAYQHLMKVHGVIDYRAYATSAMREARNQEEVIARVKAGSGVDLEVIDGNIEARIIYANRIENLIRSKAPALYVDVGGGSTEITLFKKRKTIESLSFKIGTVRILNGKVKEEEWQRLKNWVKELRKEYCPEYLIGTGGNINTIMKVSSAAKNAKYITTHHLEEVYDKLKKYSFDERIYLLDMKPDRADVIMPAADVFRSILGWSKCERIYVPQVGLVDGVIHELYSKFKADNLSVLT